jgi:hypothetical protein
MIEMTDEEKIERANLFLENKTYTYIKDIYNYNFNGFIISIDDIKITLKDDILGNIPIRISDIQEINYSTKNKGGSEK